MKRVRYKSHAGIVIRDRDKPVHVVEFKTAAQGPGHMRRAAYLATMLESPHWGTVQGYDNCGLSAGPFHWIGRYPRTGKQGPLFGLLRRVEQSLGDNNDDAAYEAKDHLGVLWNALRDRGLYVAMDGKLRSYTNGKLITGTAFRDVVAPIKGKVSVKGADRVYAEEWAMCFHRLLKDEATYSAQVDYAIDYLTRGQGRLEMKVYRKLTGNPELVMPDRVAHMSTTMDLAMCVYHAFSVNAPSPAAACLRSMPLTKAALSDPRAWSRQLIKKLATRKYGNWAKRYTKTRKAAMESNYWFDDRFKGKDAVMPAKFK